jgi:hypothetical protein
MRVTSTPTVQRQLSGIAYALGLLLCGLFALPASAIEQIGFQSIINFDELASGTTTIKYGLNNFNITGGVVQAGSLEFPAHSSSNVYYSAGGSIGTSSSDGYSLYGYDGWPFIGAYVTPSTATVTATFTSYPGYPSPPYLPATMTTVGLATNQLLEFTDPGNNVFAVSFSSTAPYAIDDLIPMALTDDSRGFPFRGFADSRWHGGLGHACCREITRGLFG